MVCVITCYQVHYLMPSSQPPEQDKMQWREAAVQRLSETQSDLYLARNHDIQHFLRPDSSSRPRTSKAQRGRARFTESSNHPGDSKYNFSSQDHFHSPRTSSASALSSNLPFSTPRVGVLFFLSQALIGYPNSTSSISAFGRLCLQSLGSVSFGR